MALTSNYRHDIRRARARVARGSKLLHTAAGPIEYAEMGERAGPPLLVIHGAGGGYDQGLDIAAGLDAHGFRIIAVSRFGYLRTPLPQDGSAAAQAAAHAAVLDALHIQRCAVLGVSAGGPSAMQLALRYPNRVQALVLMVPAAWAPGQDGGAPRKMSALVWSLIELTLRSDFLFWLALRVAPRFMTRTILGTPPRLVARAAASEQARVRELIEHILPVAPRRLGLLNDSAVVPALQRCALEELTAPTLIFSAEDDGYGTYTGSRYSAAHMPNARFVGYVSGGHMLVGHQEEMTSEIARFLKVHAEHAGAATTGYQDSPELRDPSAVRICQL